MTIALEDPYSCSL